MGATTSLNNKKRLSRKEFLARALEVLSKEGEAELRIDRLVDTMGVTKGSFYWHFENRADFVRSLAEYWKEWSTERVVKEIGELPSGPKTLLSKIQEIVTRGDLTRYDLVMRSWATHEPEVARIVGYVDNLRYDTVCELFKRLGYQRDDLDARAYAFVVLTSFWSAVRLPDQPELSSKRLARLLEILTADG